MAAPSEVTAPRGRTHSTYWRKCCGVGAVEGWTSDGAPSLAGLCSLQTSPATFEEKPPRSKT